MYVLPAGFSWDDDTYLFCGTVDYSSVRTLFGRHPTPKDDLEGLACTLLEMATGEGWQHFGGAVWMRQVVLQDPHSICSARNTLRTHVLDVMRCSGVLTHTCFAPDRPIGRHAHDLLLWRFCGVMQRACPPVLMVLKRSCLQESLHLT